MFSFQKEREILIYGYESSNLNVDVCISGSVTLDKLRVIREYI